MNTKTYRYSGPVSGMTLRDGQGEREIMLHPGRDVRLPPDHPHVRALVARGHLTEPPAKAAAPAPAKKTVKQEEK